MTCSRYGWYVVAVLLVAYTLSFVDRTILTLLVEPIKRDLGLSDTQVSLLHGLAFAVFYTALGIPIARLADRASRRNIVAAGIAVWSLMTAVCGLARNFGQLFLARVGVGVGEAALSPAAITAMFPPDVFGRPWRKNYFAVMKDLRKNYVDVTSEHFLHRLHSKEQGALAPYLLPFCESSLRELSGRYGFRPAGVEGQWGRMLVESFRDHDGFSVRTFGFGDLGATGVCFGDFIGLDSPAARFGGFLIAVLRRTR